MRRTSLAVVVSLLLAATVSAAENVRFKSSAGEANGYLATPVKDTGKHPAIIVIQEWWGLNDWVKQQTLRFADLGYVALAVDLYRGKIATSQDEAHELMRGLPEDRAMADLQAGFRFLAARKDVDAKRIAVIGWCMGGGYALMLATDQPRLAAGVVNYGHLMTDPKTIAKIKVPLLGNFGAEDRGIPAADVREFESELKKAGKFADFKVYPGAGHAFMNPDNKGGYVPDAAADAWKRIDDFLAERLHGKMPNS
jgi:carboxymethylenebutenolidase